MYVHMCIAYFDYKLLVVNEVMRDNLGACGSLCG